ncbi:MAG: ABC transporter permease [Treponema sp.]|nr:ABC transporter permease [Treponema sp.]
MDTVKRKKKPSLYTDIWRRFRRSPPAMIGLILIALLVLAAIFAEFITPEGPDNQDFARMNVLPMQRADVGTLHIFGTDNLGRDQFTRIIYGARTSLQIGFIVVGIAMVFGVLLGSIAGYYGGVRDTIIMRVVDVFLAIPNILLAIAIASALGPGMFNVMIAVGIGSIPGYSRMVRAAVLTVRENEFVEAARAIGGNDVRIILRHIIPNCMAPLIVQATLGLAGSILAAAGLSFIGLGVMPPIPEWGYMLSQGRRFIRDFPHLSLYPGFAIVIVVLAFNMLGDGLRDAFDPKLKT